MEIRGVSQADIYRAAKAIHATVERYRATNLGHAFVLRPEHGSDLYRALGYGDRRVNAICWHGHKEFLNRIYEVRPSAVVISTVNRYNGKADYEYKLRTGAGEKIGFQSTARCKCGAPAGNVVPLRRG